MRAQSPAALVALALGIAIVGLAGGCGGGDETVVSTPQSERAASSEVRRVLALANATFAEGDYARTCSLYTAALKLEVARSASVSGCEEAQEVAARRLRATASKAQLDALTAYVVEDVEIDGDSAIARYGPLPKLLADLPGLNGGRLLDVERIAGQWRIASLPY